MKPPNKVRISADNVLMASVQLSLLGSERLTLHRGNDEVGLRWV